MRGSQESQRRAEEKRAVMVSIPGRGLLELCSASSYSQNIHTARTANIGVWKIFSNIFDDLLTSKTWPDNNGFSIRS